MWPPRQCARGRPPRIEQAEGEVAALYGRSKAFLRARILELALATGEELFRSTIRIAATDEDPVLRAMAARSSLA